jgi:hypothetical protein
MVIALLLLAAAAAGEGASGVKDVRVRPDLSKASPKLVRQRLPVSSATWSLSSPLRPPLARRTQLYLLFASRLVQTIQRVAIGPLIVYIFEELNCGIASRAKLLSAYSLGYLSAQVCRRHIRLP